MLHGFSGSSQDWKLLSVDGLTDFQGIMPDLRGHGRSGTLTAPFRHRDATEDIFALLDHLGIGACKGLGISAGGNILLHMAAAQPDRVKAMVLVSATPYYPAQARAIMRAFPDHLPDSEWERMRRASLPPLLVQPLDRPQRRPRPALVPPRPEFVSEAFLCG